MLSEDITRFVRSKLKPPFKRFVLPLLRTILMSIISLLFVQIPKVCHFLFTFGKEDEKSNVHHRIRAKITNPSDPFSPYRALEVPDKLITTPDERVQTLADIPEYCLERYAEKETLGVREVRNVEDEKQPNGKIFKKVFILQRKKQQQIFLSIDIVHHG